MGVTIFLLIISFPVLKALYKLLKSVTKIQFQEAMDKVYVSKYQGEIE